MYIFLLCGRYLCHGRAAWVCILSVMLGVATLIVTNSVLGGFSNHLRERLQGAWSDVILEARSLEGFANPQERMARIRRDPFLNAYIEHMVALLECPAMLQVQPLPTIDMSDQHHRQPSPWFSCPVQVVGIDPQTSWEPLQQHLVQPTSPRQALFATSPDGIVVSSMLLGERSPSSHQLQPGLSVDLAMLHGDRLEAVQELFTIVACFRSETSGYGSHVVFVPLDRLQKLRGLPNRVTSLHLKLKNYARDHRAVKQALAELFPADALQIQTWEERQAPLLSAVVLEEAILHVFLLLILCVAGFSILAIFSMLAANKRRDIGILKALGAGNGGVRYIFLGYGLLLGIVGAGLGTGLGLVLTWNMNAVERFLSSWLDGGASERKIYLWTCYFNEIPTHLHVPSILWINSAAIGLAILFSVLPARQAAQLEPVSALRGTWLTG